MFFKNKKTSESENKYEERTGNVEKSSEIAVPEKNELSIEMEQVPIEMIPDDEMLSEVTDNKLLSRIDNLIPGFEQTGTSAVNLYKDNKETVYRAIIPAGTKLSNSSDMEGAVRGMYHGGKGIKGHANLVAVDNTGTNIVNVASAAMGIASMVVGQYYMTQINSELSEISDGLEKISSFQDNEYKSRVFALIVQVKKISQFQGEILENDSLRRSELDHLNKLEDQCLELLGQANLTLVGFTKNHNLDYESYEKKTEEAQIWYAYQQNLLEIMIKISELKYTLHMGDVSRKQCTALLPTYFKQTKDTLNKLSGWHTENTRRLGINISDSKRKRYGLDGAIHWLPGLFINSLNYTSVNEKLVEMVLVQNEEIDYESRVRDSELYDQDVQLISKNGKIYYLPSEDEISRGTDKMINNRRAKLREVFKDTQKFYTEEPLLIDAVNYGRENTKLYEAEDYPDLQEIGTEAENDSVSHKGAVRITKDKTFEAAVKLHKEFPDKKIAVLNFASATNPGGGVKTGSSAQEESLCRCSTLFPTIDRKWLWQKYYDVNRNAYDVLHTDACIYSPGVIICKTDESIPQRLDKEHFVTVDVISCAAPNLRDEPTNFQNPETGAPVKMDFMKQYELHVQRAKHILHIAAYNKVDILVLGAFGCGAFQNDPDAVSKAYNTAIEEYRSRFDVIDFAIYCRDYETQNYEAFKKNLGRLEG